ncbi:MAG: C40 family peptidase [Burkholderiales bacterium]|nr:C40 family peptidase [Burkholderiales bacterium]
MCKWLSIWLLAACATVAHAAPPTIADDPNARALGERGLLDRWQQVRQSVTENVGDRAFLVADRAGQVAQRASDLVINAMAFLGMPYRRGGASAETGFDCSGFVKAMYEQTLGLVLPRRANEQAHAGEHVQPADLQPGDLVFFNTMRRTFSHVGIYVGDGKFIHSPKPGAQVRVEDMGANYWKTRFDGARRLLQRPVWEPTPVNATAP